MPNRSSNYGDPRLARVIVRDIAASFQGDVLVTVPHMDDCVLGNGGTVSKATDKSRIHFVYCTDGRGETASRHHHAGEYPGTDIGLVRMEETKAAMKILGIAAERLHFLKFPEWGLARHRDALRESLGELVRSIRPAHVLTPFRYDKHTDHVTLSEVTRRIVSKSEPRPELLEYFVYFKWRLLPSGDIRTYVNPDCLLASDISNASAAKRKALDCFVSQTTCFFPWQHKPVLSAELLDEFCRGPEFFLKAPDLLKDRGIFRIPVSAVRFLCTLEPALKAFKERVLSARHNLLRVPTPGRGGKVTGSASS